MIRKSIRKSARNAKLLIFSQRNPLNYRFLNTVGIFVYYTESNEGYFQNINDSDTYLKTEGYLVNC